MNNLYAKPDPRREIAMAKTKASVAPKKEYAPTENRLISKPTHSKNDMNRAQGDTHQYTPPKVEAAPETASPVR